MALDENRRGLLDHFAEILHGKLVQAGLVSGSIFQRHNFNTAKTNIGRIFAMERAIQAQGRRKLLAVEQFDIEGFEVVANRYVVSDPVHKSLTWLLVATGNLFVSRFYILFL
jgi:hypothetical protein